VARSPDEYVALAVALAHDRERLRRLREGARARLAAHGLVDGARVAAAFARAVRVAWRALVR
jgi:predicted O-linked N-acetylglucosamine transferase (SPINDLY family)